MPKTSSSLKLQNDRKKITFHRLCGLSLSDFIKDIQQSVMLSSTDDLVETYNTSFKDLIGKHLSTGRMLLGTQRGSER